MKIKTDFPAIVVDVPSDGHFYGGKLTLQYCRQLFCGKDQ